MKKIAFIVYPVLSGFLIGCAYFNTFYNIKMYFNRASKATEANKTNMPGSDEQSNYQKAVEKAILLLENYPDSKWADDALLVLGKSYYFLRDYPSSERRLNELISDYPKSDLLNEAKFWQARVKVSTSRFQEAESDLNTLVSQKISKKQTGEVYFFQAKLYESRKDYKKAIEMFQNALNVDGKTWGARAWFAIGNDYDSLGVFDQASSAFRQVLRNNPDPDLAFDAQFRYARSEKELGRFDGAVRVLESLARDEKNKSKVPVLRLEVADCLDLKGDVNGAILTYEDIIEAYPNTEYSAEAYYWLGGLYEEQKKDYERALDNYSQVKKQSARGAYADSAEIKGRDILRLKALRQVVGMALRGEKGEAVEVGSIAQEDTLGRTQQDTSRYANPQYQNPDQTANPSRNPNRIPNANSPGASDNPAGRTNVSSPYRNNPTGLSSLPQDTTLNRARPPVKIAENPELKSFNKEELDKNLFLLAELYLFRFQIPDSALSNYRTLTEKFPKSPYAPQAVYNMGYTYEYIVRDSVRADSCYKKLVEQYPVSPHARGVAKRLRVNYTISEEDSAWTAFHDAERTFLEENNPQKAVKAYLDVWAHFPKTQAAPKALYSTGWVYENAMNAPTEAYALYDSLISRYPNSTYSQKVKAKVEAVKTEKLKKAQPEKKETESKTQAPELKPPVKPEQDQQRAAADSTRTAAKPDSTERIGKENVPQEPEKRTGPADTTGRAGTRNKPTVPVD